MPFHPPAFHPDHRASDWPDCFLEIRCGTCGKQRVIPIKMILAQRQDVRLLDFVGRLKCDSCKVRPAEAFLCEKPNRKFQGGQPPGWAVELRV